MKTLIVTCATVAALTLSLGSAQAGGFGLGGNKSKNAGGLVNVSPNVNLGGIKALNNIGIANGNIASGNKTVLNLGNGLISGIGVGILNNNSKKSGGKKR